MPGVDGVLGVKGESAGITTEGVAEMGSGFGHGCSRFLADGLLTMTDSCTEQRPITNSSFLLAFGDMLRDSASSFCEVLPVWVSLSNKEFPCNCNSGGYWCNAARCDAANCWAAMKCGV